MFLLEGSREVRGRGGYETKARRGREVEIETALKMLTSLALKMEEGAREADLQKLEKNKEMGSPLEPSERAQLC